MIFKRLTILSFLFQVTVLQRTIDNYAESRRREDVDTNLLQRQCELIHYGQRLDTGSLNRCMRNLTKPGNCPYSQKYHNKMMCLETCQGHDYKCSSTQKCCLAKDCGMICQEPENLINDINLPPIPANLTARNVKRKGRACELLWGIPLEQPKNHTGPCLFIIEGRWHFGTVFSPRKLRDWEWLEYEITGQFTFYFNSSKTMQARIKLKRGRFYQFRVAMLNKYGFKGYSEPSPPFRLYDDPRPPKSPKNLRITQPKLLPNNSVYAKITWSPNKSDLPIEKYHISWALFIKAENNSLLIDDTYVREPTHSYEFWNLLPNSLYFIQIQAIAVHGRRRPKSKKKEIFCNTTMATSNILDYEKEQMYHRLNSRQHFSQHSNIDGLINSTGYSIMWKNKNLFSPEFSESDNLQAINSNLNIKFIPSKKYGLLVRVTLPKNSNNEKYLLELCPGNFPNCESKEYEAAKTKKDQIDFSQLKFNKRYTIRLIDTNHIDFHNSGIVFTKTFTTPSCTDWLKKHQNLKLNLC